MSTYQRETRVRAPLEEVWTFHSTTDGLETLTPDWLHLRIERSVGPDGEADPDVLLPGTEIDASIRPFDVGPRRDWTSKIVERERSDATAYFTDEMVRGPFDRWEHTHSFFADGPKTLVRDRVVYELPFGPIGDLFDPAGALGFEPMFTRRHHRTKVALERP